MRSLHHRLLQKNHGNPMIGCFKASSPDRLTLHPSCLYLTDKRTIPTGPPTCIYSCVSRLSSSQRLHHPFRTSYYTSRKNSVSASDSAAAASSLPAVAFFFIPQLLSLLTLPLPFLLLAPAPPPPPLLLPLLGPWEFTPGMCRTFSSSKRVHLSVSVSCTCANDVNKYDVHCRKKTVCAQIKK